MKNKIIVLLLFVFGLFLVGCEKDKEYDLKLEGKNSGKVGDVIDLTLLDLPEKLTDEVVWSVNDPTLASVENGKVTLLAEGVVSVSAAYKKNSVSFSITIDKADDSGGNGDVATTKITLTGALEGEAGDSITLSAQVEPTNATNKAVVWSSSDNSVATVTNGQVSLLKAGVVTITAAQGAIKGTLKITVKEKEVVVIPTTEILLEGADEGEVGDKVNLVASVKPDEATNQDVVWSSSDELLATVEDGQVNLLKAGVVTITATQGEFSKSHQITIYNELIYADEIEFVSDRVDGVVGQEINFLVNVLPKNATHQEIEVVCEDDFVTIEGGKITLVKIGTATIKFIQKDVEKEFSVRVYDHLDYIFKLFKDNRKKEITLQQITHYGASNYKNQLYPSVFPYMFNDPLEIDRSIWLPLDHPFHSKTKGAVEWIVIHDTANISANAKANTQYMINNTERTVSWQYTVDDEKVYQAMEDEDYAYHASAGSTTAVFTDTGIPAVNPWLRTRFTLDANNYFQINGVTTNIKAPGSVLPQLGLWPVIINGTYHVPDVRIRKSDSGRGDIVGYDGGNLDGVGIETCMNNTADLYAVWSKTAQLVAHLLLKHNLEGDRVCYHNSFNDKECPKTAMRAGKVEEWFDLIKFEYEIMRYFSDFQIDFTSQSPNFLDSRGRVNSNLQANGFVQYTLKITAPDGRVKTESFRTTAK